jgi:hypothetical protein
VKTSAAQTNPASYAAGQIPSVHNLWGGMGRVTDPAVSRARVLEACSSRKHVRQVGTDTWRHKLAKQAARAREARRGWYRRGIAWRRG